MEYTNEMTLEIVSRSCNESLARVTVASFATQLNPTLEEVADIKTAVSEAITNCIIHAYDNKKQEKIRIECKTGKRELFVTIIDYGKGIADIKQAMEPMFTTRPDQERSGMGFAFMEAFMDELLVESEVGKGTTVRMRKKIGISRESFEE